MSKKGKGRTEGKPDHITIMDMPYQRHRDHEDIYAYGALVQHSPNDVVIHLGYVDQRGDSGDDSKKSPPPVFMDRMTVRMPPDAAISLAMAILQHVSKNSEQFVIWDPSKLQFEMGPTAPPDVPTSAEPGPDKA